MRKAWEKGAVSAHGNGPKALVVTEKGSVAKAVRSAIKGAVETFPLSGHVLELDFPEEYSNWRKVDPKQLFQAPVKWMVRDEKAYGRLIEMLRKNEGLMLVLATDNDHEGELIAYEALLTAERALGRALQFKRMRFNSTAPQELKRAWESLEPDLNWGWVWKAYFRHKFDLITGAAYTRLLTLSARRAGVNVELLSWGSCQTPTLWFVVKREEAIKSFKPEVYYTLKASLNARGVDVKVESPPIKEEEKAKALYEAVKGVKTAFVEDFRIEAEVNRRPLPTDTDVMLQELTKILNVSSSKIMNVAEELYAEGYISYPRTQTNKWIKFEHMLTLKELKRSRLAEYVRLDSINPRSGGKDDGAHPPLHPIKPYEGVDLKGRIWEYVARRYLANVVYGDAKLNHWRLSVKLNEVSLSASGRYFIDEGFYAVFPYFKPKQVQRIPELRQGEELSVEAVELLKRKTEPPPRLTESELLRLMEKNSIGTDATRHEYPTIIINRGYAKREGRSFRVTELGEALTNLLAGIDEKLVTPETRRLVENIMEDVERQKISVDEALNKALPIYVQLYSKLDLAIKQGSFKLKGA